ncbi:MAG: serine/threonine-protein kinase [Myxococcaceae bacterium]
MPQILSSPQAQRELVPPAVVLAGAGPVTLKQLLASLGPATRLTVSASLYVAEQLARSVAQMHEHGRVHGLLSTSQVQVFSDGSVRVCGPEGAPRPPTAYLAPEVRNGTPPDVLADVHAIGAITFELLTGMTVLQAFVRAPMRELTRTPAPSLFNPGVDLSIDELVTAAVDRDPGVRPHSVRALHDGIRHCFGELDLEPSPVELAAVVSERFPAASLVPLQMPVPAPPAVAPPNTLAAPKAAPALAPTPRAPVAERFEAAAPTSRFNVRKHLAEIAEEEAYEEETTGSTEIPVPSKWASGRKWVVLGLGGAVALAAALLVIVSWPTPAAIDADELPVARSQGKVNPVFVPPPPEPAPAVAAPAVKAAPVKKAPAVKKATKSGRRRR